MGAAPPPRRRRPCFRSRAIRGAHGACVRICLGTSDRRPAFVIASPQDPARSGCPASGCGKAALGSGGLSTGCDSAQELQSSLAGTPFAPHHPAMKKKRLRSRRASEPDLKGPPPREAMLMHDDRELQAEPVDACLTGGDVDADWRRADSVGEEAVGGTVATPDQSVVDDLGLALGVPRSPDEEVRTDRKSVV